jgi:hypothetical protein
VELSLNDTTILEKSWTGTSTCHEGNEEKQAALEGKNFSPLLLCKERSIIVKNMFQGKRLKKTKRRADD